MYFARNLWKNSLNTPNSTFLLARYPLCTIVGRDSVRDSLFRTMQQ
jgi:hypothetical protein